MMKTVCVYCGSSAGANKIYKEAAIELGKEISGRNLVLVFGGGNIGLMDAVSGAVLDNGGKAIGVIPRGLFNLKLARKGPYRSYNCKRYARAKSKNGRTFRCFYCLAGGIGTLEEFAEAVTWNQLHIHQKPCGLLNVNGYFDKLDRFS